MGKGYEERPEVIISVCHKSSKLTSENCKDVLRHKPNDFYNGVERHDRTVFKKFYATDVLATWLELNKNNADLKDFDLIIAFQNIKNGLLDMRKFNLLDFVPGTKHSIKFKSSVDNRRIKFFEKDEIEYNFSFYVSHDLKKASYDHIINPPRQSYQSQILKIFIGSKPKYKIRDYTKIEALYFNDPSNSFWQFLSDTSPIVLRSKIQKGEVTEIAGLKDSQFYKLIQEASDLQVLKTYLKFYYDLRKDQVQTAIVENENQEKQQASSRRSSHSQQEKELLEIMASNAKEQQALRRLNLFLDGVVGAGALVGDIFETEFR